MHVFLFACMTFSGPGLIKCACVNVSLPGLVSQSSPENTPQNAGEGGLVMTSGVLRRSLMHDFGADVRADAKSPVGPTPPPPEQTLEQTLAVDTQAVADPPVEPKASGTPVEPHASGTPVGPKASGTPADRTQAVLQANKDRRDSSADVLRQALLALGPPGQISPEELARELASLHAQVHDVENEKNKKMLPRVPDKEPSNEMPIPKAMPAEKAPDFVQGNMLGRGKSSVCLQVAAPTSGLPTVRYDVPDGDTKPLPTVAVVTTPAPDDAANETTPVPAPGPASAPESTGEVGATPTEQMEPPHTERQPAHAGVANPGANPTTTVAVHPAPPPDVDTQQLLEELRTRVV
jgi:hypothetical protein